MADPITLAATAASGLIGSLFGAKSSGSAAPTPSAPPPMAPPAQDPTGTRSGKGTTAAPPSFVGSTAVPQQTGYGQKSLLGQ